MNRLLGEENVFFFISIITLFLLINFDRTFGLIYGFMFITTHLLAKSSKLDIPISKGSNDWFLTVLFALIGYESFIFISYGLSNLIRPSAVAALGGSFQSVISAMATDIPALAASVPVIIFAWSFLIPIYESSLVAVFLERFASMFDIPLSKNDMFNVKTLSLFTAVGLIMAYFHLTAKLNLGDLAFITTFVFFVVTCFMFVFFGEQKQGMIMHMVANGRSSLIKYGYLTVKSFGGL